MNDWLILLLGGIVGFLLDWGVHVWRKRRAARRAARELRQYYRTLGIMALTGRDVTGLTNYSQSWRNPTGAVISALRRS